MLSALRVQREGEAPAEGLSGVLGYTATHFTFSLAGLSPERMAVRSAWLSLEVTSGENGHRALGVKARCALGSKASPPA